MARLDIPQVFSRLIDRLGLYGAGSPAQQPDLSRIVVPVVDIGAQETRGVGANMSLTGTSFVSLDQVPRGERWRVQVAEKSVSVGSCAIAVRVKDEIGGTVVVRLSPAATAAAVALPGWLVLEELDDVGAIGGGNAADTGIGVNFLYTIVL